jgi:hypothetical protein
MAKNGPIPLPPDGMALLAWLAENPQAVRQAIEALNLLITLEVQITTAGSTRGQQGIVTSADRFLMPIPLKLPVPIADSTATAASVSTQLNLLLAGLRQTTQLPR